MYRTLLVLFLPAAFVSSSSNNITIQRYDVKGKKEIWIGIWMDRLVTEN